MYVIGITGGVGSGKSYAAHRLQEKLGATLLIADELGHVVMEPGRSAYCQIVEHFGQNIVSSDGSIDRAALAEIVFSDVRARDWLNQVIHPAVIEYIRDTIRQNRTRSGILLIETALMYETGCDRLCDEVWLVYVPEEERTGVWHRTAVILNRNQRRSSKARFRKHCYGRKYSALFQMMEQKKIWSGHWMRCLQPLIPLH